MKFVCERCHTKYSIADEKVRGKVLKVRCKTCTNVITVRETGATIDDLASDAPREAPIARSGSFDAGDGDTVVAPRAALGRGRGGGVGAVGGAGLAGLPAAALFAPGVPAVAPPARRTVPPPAPVPEIDWYLAIDGAQTGPFSRGRLIDKILVAPKSSDVHIWNAEFDGWKPPNDVVELHAELSRRRRSVTPVAPPPLRRASGAVAPLAATGDPLADAALLPDGPAAAADAQVVPPRLKKNGLAARTATTPGMTGLGELLGSGMGATHAPAAALAAARAAGVADPLAMSTPAPALVPGPAAAVARAPATAGKRNQLKLVLGAFAVVLVLCGIVSIWMFRRPAVTVAVGEAAPPRPTGTDFAGMAEKLAQEEKMGDKGAPPVAPPAPPTIDSKPVIARLEPPPSKGAKAKPRKKNQTTPPPLTPTFGSSGLTAEQRNAASRFGDSTGRELRVPTSGGGGGARTTPAQADISRVINNNRQGIQTCYQRALLRDNTLTHGKVTVRVSIGLSGKVRSVNLDAPAQFRALEPCIRDVMSRWAFPPSSEEYGTEFPVVLQGNQ